MGKIIGESFDDYVKKQIDIRQRKLGTFQRDNDILTYLTGKTSWIRLTSGVDVSEDKCRELDIDTNFKGSELAKKYILFNGVASYNGNGTTTLKEGLPEGNYPGLGSSAAYGFNSAANFGLVPTPGIESIEVVPKNRGSLRTATINIKCFNREQFTIIETLFLRLKYTLLLEWGHSIYFDNGGNLVTSPKNDVYKQFLTLKPTPPPPTPTPEVVSFTNAVTPEETLNKAGIKTADTLLDSPQTTQPQPRPQSSPDPNQTQILNAIQSQRKNSNGNYDGFLGWVTNFSWKLEAGNVYSITIKATTYGDIIESLSATNAVAKTTVPDNEVELTKGESSPLGLALLRFKQRMDSLGSQTTANGLRYTAGDYGGDLNQIKDIIKAANIPYDPGSSGREVFERAIVKVFDVGFFGGETVSAYYIKLGFLLNLIQNFFYKYDIKSNPNNPPPINRFAYRPGDNFIKPDDYPSTCNLTNELFSVNPKICIVPSSVSVETGGLSTSYVALNTISGSEVPGGGTKRIISNETANLADLNDLTGVTAGDRYHFWSLKNQGKQAGLTMHIQLNIDMVLQVLNENVDEEGNIAYIDFLQSILSNINKALVGVTNLTLFYDENINTYFIIDENCTLAPKSFGESDEKPTEIIIGTLKEGKGSFALEASIDSQITNKLASQLAIGAQANDQDVGTNTFAISTWNTGLTDRIISSKAVNYSNNAKPQQVFESTFNKQKLGQILKRYINLSLTDEDITELQGLGKEYITVQRDLAVQSGNLASNFFIPISLNLTLDGISGPKIFQKYTINDIILPRNYENNIEFLVKGIAHKVDRSGWTTTLESLSIPKPKDVNFVSTTPTPSTPSPGEGEWVDNLEIYAKTQPWSAAFISWVAQQALGSDFPRAGGHAEYANSIVRLSKLNGSKWQVLNPATTSIKFGDIIVSNRCSFDSNNNPTSPYGKNKFNSPSYNAPTHGDIITSIQGSKAIGVGGNLTDKVKTQSYPILNGKVTKLATNATLGENGAFVILRYNDSEKINKLVTTALGELQYWGSNINDQNLNDRTARRLYAYYVAGRFTVLTNATPP